MDNTLKVIIGVLSVAGLLALLTPEVKPVQQPAEAVVETAPPVATADAAEGEEALEEETPESEEEEFNVAAFGEPMMDGKPIDPLADEGVTGGGTSSRNSPNETPVANGGQPNVVAVTPVSQPSTGGLPPPVPLPASQQPR